MGKHVLVPIDGSSTSEKALGHVLQEFQEPRLTLVHVINPVNSYTYADADYFDFEGYQEAVNRQREQAEEMLEHHKTHAEDRGLEVETIITVGNPSEKILETAEERRPDQIVMGSRGRSGVGRVLFGSVAETVTRRAGVPVTIIK